MAVKPGSGSPGSTAIIEGRDDKYYEQFLARGKDPAARAWLRERHHDSYTSPLMLSGLLGVDPGISPQEAEGESDSISGYVYQGKAGRFHGDFSPAAIST